MHRKLYILCYDEHEGRKDRSSRAPASLFQEMPTEKYMMCFDILTALQQNKYPAPAEWLNDMIVCMICVCVSVSFIHVNCDLSSRLLMHRSFFLFFFFFLWVCFVGDELESIHPSLYRNVARQLNISVAMESMVSDAFIGVATEIFSTGTRLLLT